MRTVLTAERFRLIWRLAGGDAIPMPIQAPARGRTVGDRDRILGQLGRWWADNQDPDLYAAVRDLRQARAWLHLEAFPTGGNPIRALLGAAPEGGAGDAVLAVQDAVPAVRDANDRDWYPDTAIDPSGWSLERGGDIRLSMGHVETLVARMAEEVPDFQPGSSPAMRADTSARPAAGFTRRATTTSKSERIQALLARPRTLHGSVAASITEGSGPQRVGALNWIVVAGDGGYLVAGDDTVSLRPASRADLSAAARRLLASTESAADLV